MRYRDHDPANFSPAAVASNRQAVILRYRLNPYLYTLFHVTHVSGGTVVRSMAHEFPTVSECLALDEQFLWGSSLLIAPVIYENQITKWVYLPMTDRWFDYYTGQEQITRGATTVSAPLDFIPLFLRGGSIIPHQQPDKNTVASRSKPMYLIVALDAQQTAEGTLFWDDGESIDTYETSKYNYISFYYSSSRLTIEPWTFKYPDMDKSIVLDEIKIFGLNKQPTRIVRNGQELTSNTQWTFDSDNKVLYLKNLSLRFSDTHKINIL